MAGVAFYVTNGYIKMYIRRNIDSNLKCVTICIRFCSDTYELKVTIAK